MINKNFTLIWTGKSISQLGDKFYSIALAWWILQKTDSPSIMGTFLLVSVLPGLILGFFAGVLADRLSRKTILIVTDTLRGFLVLTISFLAMFGVIEVWHVFVIGMCLSLATAFFDPAIQAIIPEIVEKEDLTRANAMSQMVSGVCTVAGPLLGAVSVSFFGLTAVFMANSVSYFISTILTSFVSRPKVTANYSNKNNYISDIKEGIRFIKNQKNIIFVLKIIALTHIFVGCLTVSLPFLANSLTGIGVNNLGYLEAAMGTGVIGSSIIIKSVRKNIKNEFTLVKFIALMGISFGLISTFKFIGINTTYIYLVIMVIVGSCIAFASVFWLTLLQNSTPSNMTGRVFSVSSLIGNTSLPIAYSIFGVLLNISSISVLMAISGGGLLILCFSFYFQKIKMKSL